MNEKLKAVRLNRNWTPAQVSAFLEINDQTYANWENGKTPSERNIKKLCALFRKTREVSFVRLIGVFALNLGAA